MITRIRKSLMLKWTVFSIFIATIPLSIAGIRMIQIIQRNLKRSVIEMEGMKANIIVEKTVSFFDRLLNDLDFAARRMEMPLRTSGLHPRDLEEMLYKNDSLIELTLLNEKGREVLKVSKHHVVDPSNLKERSKSELFGRASKGEVYYGDFRLTSDGVPTLVVAISISDLQGRIHGVLGARIHLRYLWNLLPQTQIGKEGSTYVVAREGELIAHPDTRKVFLGLNVRHFPMVDQVVRGEAGAMEFEYPKGKRYLGVYKPIRELGWGVIVQLPVEEAYQPVADIARTAVKWILIAFGVAVVLGLFLTRRLTLPIKELSGKMEEASKGDLNLSLVPRSEDEIGHLTRSFNRMIQDLKQSQKLLREAEEKYRRIFENSKDMVFITSPEGKFIDVNQAGVTLLGYEDKEALFRDSVAETYAHPGDRVRFQQGMTREG
ncbi:MAG: sensor histidine kinase, partial [Deltaproteobacteria bacterium]